VGIVGGSGYIGGAIARELSKKHVVKVIDIREPTWNIKDYNISFCRCDIRTFECVQECLQDVDIVIHTAIIQIPRINEEKRLGFEINYIGTINVCEAVYRSPRVKGLVLTGSWHVFGESGLTGDVDEYFGYRPDKVEDRAKLYVFSKIAQEVITRYYDGMSEKIYGVIRLGTVLGEGMPEKTAANIFIERGLKGEPLTPYKHSMYRPMLYVDVRDVVKAFDIYVNKIVNGEVEKHSSSLNRVLNIIYPEPITILELAEIVRDTIAKLTNGKIVPKIEIVDQGLQPLFTEDSKYKFKVDISKTMKLLGIEKLIEPRKSIEDLVKSRLQRGM
jgi:nucleoside-diphosphate-sugar epimerase